MTPAEQAVIEHITTNLGDLIREVIHLTEIIEALNQRLTALERKP